MKLSTKEVFPGLEGQLSSARFKRVDDALYSLFNRTTQYTEDGLPFVITGDIPAMWLRDSTWQVKPLLVSQHPDVIEFLINLSKAQIKYFLIDPYANAFNPAPNGNCWRRDFVDQSPWVFERKYELDSWASILYLARKIFEVYGATEHLNQDFRKALDLMLELAKTEQNHNPESYIFKRDNCPVTDFLSHDGRGAPVGYTGMIFSAFRPSDDACKYGYLVPSNLFFANELRNLPSPVFTSAAQSIAEQIQHGIEKFALKNGVLAYEVDGLGNTEFMDDANTPSLLSLPFLEAIEVGSEIYQDTRLAVLSESNPYFYSGKWATGVGSPHTPNRHVWPISIAMAAITSHNKEFQLETLDLLERTDAGTGQMHESFDVDDPDKFTRPWFSWSDMTYVELVLASLSH
jgi:meiotically up-regulated gene 157 (Mug157) protein